jgi:hypothetical protein
MLSHATFAAALLWLAPHLPRATAEEYADIIQHQARRRGIDPLLVAAFIEVESKWTVDKVSPTYDFGLCQLHVSKHSLPQYRAREWVLFSPIRNIHECVDLMATWRSYHKRACQGGHRTGRAHRDFIEHLKFGRSIGKSTGHAERVREIEARLRSHIYGLTGV